MKIASTKDFPNQFSKIFPIEEENYDLSNIFHESTVKRR